MQQIRATLFHGLGRMQRVIDDEMAKNVQSGQAGLIYHKRYMHYAAFKESQRSLLFSLDRASAPVTQRQ